MRRKIIYVDNFLTSHGQTPTTGTTLVRLFREEGYAVVTTSKRRNKLLRLADMVFTIAINGRNAVVLIATYSTSAFNFAWVSAVTCQIFRIPYVPCLHGGNLPERIKNSAAKSADIFAKSFINVAVSGYLKKSMTDNGWTCVVIPNNINIGAYSFKLRAACTPSILWVRSFHQIYNPALAIRVLHSLSKTYPSATITMVGPDKDGSLQKCKVLAKELGVEAKVKFTGLMPTGEWVDMARSCDIFINTTNFDNLPVSVLEAMALGMVTISTNVGGVPFLIEDEANGILVPAADESAFLKAIDKVLTDKELSRRLSIAARKKAEQFDWSMIKTHWKRLFESIPA